MEKSRATQPLQSSIIASMINSAQRTAFELIHNKIANADFENSQLPPSLPPWMVKASRQVGKITWWESKYWVILPFCSHFFVSFLVAKTSAINDLNIAFTISSIYFWNDLKILKKFKNTVSTGKKQKCI